MSTIYSAGQFDDAFNPRKLGNWEAGAKEAYPFVKRPKEFFQGTAAKTEIIVNSRGHLLPWVPRDKTSPWGLLNYYLQADYERKLTHNPAPIRQLVVQKKKKLPKFSPKKCALAEPSRDLLLECLQELSLPIIWIIGPATRHIFQKRKEFAKQLASNLGFAYINLDDKIQEWKERQTSCRSQKNQSDEIDPSESLNLPPIGDAPNLVATSIAPFKLPTNVPLRVSSEVTSQLSSESQLNLTMLSRIIESERIMFDTALPLGRTKIFQLNKFAMMESLPCDGFVFDSVPFDLVEGLSFEKTFYPAALAIYFTDGVPHKKKKLKPKDRRVTANTADPENTSKKILLSPLEYLEKCKKASENAFIRMKNHKRLGAFSAVEGEKICKQYGSKTIRIINAEEVGRDTMDFLFELVKRNLDKYQQIISGLEKVDCRSDWPHIFQSASGMSTAASSLHSAAVGGEDSTLTSDEDLRNLIPTDPRLRRRRMAQEDTQSDPAANLPPPLVTAQNSETSLFTLPSIFKSESVSSLSKSNTGKDDDLSSENWSTYNKNNLRTTPPYADLGGAGDCIRALSRQKSADIWEKISRLESKVAGLNPESSVPSTAESLKSQQSHEKLRPPTAYTDEEERLTTAIKHAMAANLYVKEFLPVESECPEYDFGASGDRNCDNDNAQVLSTKDDSFKRYESSEYEYTDNE